MSAPAKPKAPQGATSRDERLRFEMLVADLAVGFGGVAPEQLDEAIGAAQRGVCECLSLDRSGLWLVDPDAASDLRLTHLFLRPLDQPASRGASALPPVGASARGCFPWLFGQMERGELVAIADASDLPTGAEVDRESFYAFDFRSVVVLPLLQDGALIGALSLVKTSGKRRWEPELLNRLQLVAHLFTTSLQRLRQVEALRGSEARLVSAVALAGLGFHDTRRGDRHLTFADDRLRSIIGAPLAEADAILEHWQARLHPGDQERVLDYSRRLWAGEIDVASLEYRYLHPERGVVWFSHVSRTVERDAQGRALRLIGVIQDITEREREREALKKAQAHTLAVINSTDDLIWSVDSERHGLLTWNKALRDYFFSRRGIEIAVGMTPEALLPPDYAGHWHEMYAAALREGSFTKEYSVVAGTNVLLLSIQPVERDGEVFAISVFGKDITALKRSEEALRESLEEVSQLKNRLELENRYLQREHRLLHGRGRILGESRAIMEVLTLIEQVASTGTTVLVEGETGTGKELVAQRIHELSPRHGRPMVKVNCAALPSNLVESELFGRERGAYTGAVSREAGRFEVANGATIFLDEVGELPLELQAKLLRVLEEGQFERVGSSRTLHTDARVIAATNRDLETEVSAGRFRRDLYYRLSPFPINLPPLRERREDIPLLMWAIVEEFSASMHKEVTSIPRRSVEALRLYDWPGNVRELRNVIERAMIRLAGTTLEIELPGRAALNRELAGTSLDEGSAVTSRKSSRSPVAASAAPAARPSCSASSGPPCTH